MLTTSTTAEPQLEFNNSHIKTPTYGRISASTREMHLGFIVANKLQKVATAAFAERLAFEQTPALSDCPYRP